VPDAIPARSGGTTATAVEASGGFVAPIPNPATMNPARSAVHAESVVTPCMSRSDAPTSESPTVSRSRAGSRAVSFPEIAAATNDESEIGRKRSPAPSAE